MAVMSKSEETQSGQLLIWQRRERERERENEGRQRWRGKEREGERGREILLINDVSVYSAHIFRSIQPYMYVEADQMLPGDKSSVNKTAALLPKLFNL